MAPAQVRRASSPAPWMLSPLRPSGMVRAPPDHHHRGAGRPAGPHHPLSDDLRLGALYSTNKALQTVANGDLTFRLNFFPVRDEFSILAGSIDTFTDRQHKIVQLVEESADALPWPPTNFASMPATARQLARAQRQLPGSLAAAMEQMSAAIREVARNANDTLLQTRQSSDEATHGAQRVARTITAIRTLADEIGNASGAVERLTHNANRINRSGQRHQRHLPANQPAGPQRRHRGRPGW